MIYIYGNSLAGLVCAFELSRRNIQCSYFCDPAKIASFFRGRVIEDLRVDNGMNLLEFTSFNSETDADFLSYRPWVRNDCGRFARRVKGFFDSLGISTYQVAQPLSFFRGHYYRDFIFSNSFEILQGFSSQEIERVLQEIKFRTKENNILHASRKNSEQALEFSYEEASIFNHGHLIHTEIILPFAKKLTSWPLNELLMSFHRHLWLPLYYPESLRKAIESKSWDFLGLDTKFFYPEDRYFGCPIEKMISAVIESPSVILRNKEDFAANFRGEVFLVVGEPANEMSLPPEVFGLKDLPKSKIDIVQLAVGQDSILMPFSTINFIDPRIPFYRATLQSGGPIQKIGLIHVELGGRFQVSEDEIVEHLIDVGILKTKVNVKILNRLASHVSIPTLDKGKLLDNFCNSIQKVPNNMNLVGMASCFGTYSFNDQIVQGQKAAQLGAQYV